jgi:hypothetical protein
MIIENLISFGGLTKYTNENILLREKQIKDKITIHTCNDYENSIEVIRDAKKNNEEVSIILKVYFNYPDKFHRRNRPMTNQIEEAIKRLGFIPNEFIIQFCCFINFKIFRKDYFIKFLKTLNEKYGIKKIYFEYYSVYRYDLKLINDLNEVFRDIIIFGVTGYFNFFNRVFLEKELDTIKKHKIPFVPIGILGKNHKRDISHALNKLEKFRSLDHIDLNLIFFMKVIKDIPFSFGITETSSLTNYNDLKRRIKIIKSLDFDIILDYETYFDRQMINYIKKDQYGGRYFFADYLKNIKIPFSQLKKYILYFKSPKYYLK